MLIYNARIYTACGEPIENGFIKIEDGKIAQVGQMLELKEAPQRTDFNAFGLNVYPGFIDAHCHIGVWENGIDFEGDDGNETTDPTTPQLRAIDTINPNDYCFKEAAAAGVTTVVSGMGSANAIGGEFLAMKTAGSVRIDKRILRSPVAIKFALGENPKRIYNDRDESPITRMATAALIREQLMKTKRYIADWEAYRSNLGTEDETSMPDFDMKCEALVALLERKIKAHFHCHRADDIFTAIRIAKEFSLDYVLIHATDGAKISDELKEDKVSCVIGPVIADRSKPELLNQTIENGAILKKADIPFAICTDHPENPIQYLPLAAGVAMRGGLDEKTALEAITIRAAEIVGIDDRVGSIEVGKDADIVVTEGKFYDVLTKVRLVLIDGKAFEV